MILILILFLFHIAIEVVQDATGLYQYYMKIIPTIFTTEWGGKVHSNQYTVTKRFRPFVMPDTSPGSQVSIILSLIS